MRPDYTLEPEEPETDWDLMEEKRLLQDYWQECEHLQTETDKAIEAKTLSLYEALR